MYPRELDKPSAHRPILLDQLVHVLLVSDREETEEAPQMEVGIEMSNVGQAYYWVMVDGAAVVKVEYAG